MKNTPSKTLKIGFVFDDSMDRNDGVQQYVKTLGGWLSEQGHTVRYLVGETKITDWQGDKIYSLTKNIKVSFNGNRLSIPLPANKAHIKDVLEQEKFDVLHVQTPYSPLMAQKVINLAPPTTAIVGTFHILPAGWLQSFGTKLLGIWCAKSLKNFDTFFSVSSSAQEFAQKTFKIKSHILPNVVDIEWFNVKNYKHNGTLKIIFLGRLVRRKGCEHLIRAAAILNETMPDFELIIAGDGSETENLKKLAYSLDLSNKTYFLGYIDEKDKAKLLSSANIACFPSLYGESFGIVLIEAMASGAEVVLGGNNPGYVSVLADNQTLLIDPLDHNQFANTLNLYLSDSKLRQKTAKWQKKHVQQYDVNVVGQKLVGYYIAAVENQCSTAHNNHQ